MKTTALPVAPQVSGWQKDPRLMPVVTLLQRHWPPKIQAAVDRTDCFGLYVIPEDGTCDQASVCELASYCQRAYEVALVQAGQAVTAPILPAGQIEPETIAKPLFDTRCQPKQRNKYAGTSKYLRLGYEPCGRRVDDLLAVFQRELPDLPALPLVWNARNFIEKFSQLGRFTSSHTASYTSVLRDGQPLVRFWTNTVKQAIVDILPELEARLHKDSERLGTYRYRTRELLQLEAPYPVPKPSWLKLRPCTHRVIVRTPEAAKAVGKAVREHWRLRIR